MGSPEPAEIFDSRAVLWLAADDLTALRRAVDDGLTGLGLEVSSQLWHPQCLELWVTIDEGLGVLRLRDPTGDLAAALASSLATTMAGPVTVLLALGGASQPDLVLEIGMEISAMRRGESGDGPDDVNLGTASLTADEASEAAWTVGALSGAFSLFADEVLEDAAADLGLSVPDFEEPPARWIVAG